MTRKQEDAGREFLRRLMYVDKVPDFHVRVTKTGDLRSMAVTGVQAVAKGMVRNPGEVGEEERFGITVEEADLIVENFVKEMGG